MADKAPERSVSIGLVVLLMFWFAATAALFVGLIVAARQWVTSEEQVTLLLGHVAWPYVAFVLSVPAVAVLAGRIGEIFALRNDIKKIPDILTDALAKAEELEVRVARISAQATNSVSALAGVLESKIEVWGEQLRPAQAEAQEDAAAPPQPSPQERLLAHVQRASDIFYQVLEQWNSTRRNKERILVVTRGGGNRPELVGQLRQEHAFDRNNEQRNVAIAAYLEEVFKREMGARRHGAQADRVARIDQLYAAAELEAAEKLT